MMLNGWWFSRWGWVTGEWATDLPDQINQWGTTGAALALLIYLFNHWRKAQDNSFAADRLAREEERVRSDKAIGDLKVEHQRIERQLRAVLIRLLPSVEDPKLRAEVMEMLLANKEANGD